MLTEKRHEIILQLLRKKGSITVNEIKDELGISESTIRRDLNTLDEEGRLVKVFGGAVSVNYGFSGKEPTVSQKKEINLEAKKSIARYAAALIEPDDFVYIDDVARAFRMIGEKGKTFHEYLIGSSQAKPLKDFLLEMKSAIAPDLEFKFCNVPFTGINLSLDAFDCSQTENDTGFKAEVSFGEGCQRTMEWWKKQED